MHILHRWYARAGTSPAPSLCGLRGSLRNRVRARLIAALARYPHYMVTLRFLDRSAYQVAPFRPRAVIVAHLRITEQARQHEPGVSRTFTDTAIRDHVLIRRDILSAINLAQFLSRL